MSASSTPWRRRIALALGTMIASTVAGVVVYAAPAMALACDNPDSKLRVTHAIQCDGAYGYRYYASNVHHNGTYWICDWYAYQLTWATGNEYRDSSHDKFGVICGMATRNNIVSKAQAEYNNRANRTNGVLDGCNYYTGQMRFTSGGCPSGWGADAWCADFAKYVWWQSGASLSYLNGLAGSFYTQGVNASPQTWHSRTSGYTPVPGDAVIFDWEYPYSPTDWTGEGNNYNPVNHVGLVISYSGGTLVTVEGNSGSGGLNTITRYSANSNGNILGYIAPM